MPQQSKAGTWCKICGITTISDAQLAQRAGADALGFNCYEGSPRFIAPSDLAELTAGLAVTRVALFVNATRDEVENVLRVADIDVLQFQGDEDEAYCAGFGVPYIKAIRMSAQVNAAHFVQNFSSAWAFLLDAYVADQVGGTGHQFDWAQWPDLPDSRLILAGGLTPPNVAGAITRLAPFGVDVCSGVEGSVKGKKDQQKLEDFLQEVCSVRGQ